MRRITIAAFKPKLGKEDDLLKVIDDRVPLLRKLGMLSESHDDFATFEAIDT